MSLSLFKFSLSLIVLLLNIVSNISANSVKIVPECHFQSFHSCSEPLFYFSHRPNGTGFALNRRELAMLCRSFRNVTECMGQFFQKCGTDITSEIFDLMNSAYIQKILQLCRNGEMKRNYLRHSKCLNDKIHLDEEYRNTCVKRFQATLEEITESENVDKRIGAACCAYRFWLSCSSEYAEKKCSPGDEAAKAYVDYINVFTGGMPYMVCQGKRYHALSKFCSKIIANPKKRVKGRKSDSPLSKYFALFFPNLAF